MDLTKPNQNITFKVGATNFELQRAIEAALPAAVAQTKDLAKKFKGSTEKENCSKIFNFLKNDIQYKVDGDNQKIKLPSAFLRERSGDCKSYALFTAAILSNLKIPFSFTYASYNPQDRTPEHIYVTTKNGCIIDAVWGKFNSEKKPCYKFQKPMNISYISGIKKHHSEKYEKKEEKYHNIGTVLQPAKFSGIGRTGIDWGKAVGRNFTIAEANEWFGKNITLAPARGIIEMFIRNNGGGIANFLYSMWLRDVPYELPNYKKYNTEVSAGLKAIAAKYNIPISFPFNAAEISQLNSKYTPSTGGVITTDTIKITPTIAKSLVSVLTPARYAQYMDWRAKMDKKWAEDFALIAALDKKYPLATRLLPSATDESKAKYRGIEWKWFWSLGGNPDDFNDAVKEGNTKSPRGKDANYMLNKAYNGGLSFGDLGLVIRAFVSAEAGDKFGLGDDGTFLLGINGTKGKGIGEAATVAAAITAYSAAIIPIVAFIMSEIRKSLPQQTQAELDAQNALNAQNGLPPSSLGVTDILSGNTGILLLAAAGVGAYLYLK